MCDGEWLAMPMGLDADRWVSRRGCRTILVVVHTLVSCHRLLDVVDDIESDPRIQVVYTVAPDAFHQGVAEALAAVGALVLPWHQAVRERFDLAIAASYGGLHEVHAPLLLVSHGADFGKAVQPAGGAGPELPKPIVYGLDAQRLTRNGRVLPAVLALPHDRHLDILERQCPQALPVAVVVGDVCFDRLAASLPHRRRYRDALGIGTGQKLVVVTSTWGLDGVFGHHPDLLPQLMTQLPSSQYRVAALLHPAVWGAHGRRQIRAWLRGCREAGLLMLDPTVDWRSVIVAADVVIGDHGSVSVYAAAIGRPVLHLAPSGSETTTAGSVQALLAEHTRRLDPRRPMLDQVLTAHPIEIDEIATSLTSRPGRAGILLDRNMYRLLGLRPPGRHRGPRPVAASQPDVGRAA